MLEIIGALCGFLFMVFLMFSIFRFMEKERKDISRFRENYVNALNNIANSLKVE